jgi:AmmeMemoRadiSam system protein A
MVELTPSEQRALLRLARRSIEATITGAEPPDPYADVQPEEPTTLLEEHGVFVSLHHHGRLRGCIGTIASEQPLVEEVAEQALHSAFDDPRFPPIAVDELPGLEIEITVLSPLQEVPGPAAIEIGRHGILLEKDGRRAVFLPQVASEQGWDRPTLLRQLCRKAGLPPDAWERGARLEVFEGLLFHD